MLQLKDLKQEWGANLTGVLTGDLRATVVLGLDLNVLVLEHRRVSKWEFRIHTPGVFVRVANKGDKSRQRTG